MSYRQGDETSNLDPPPPKNSPFECVLRVTIVVRADSAHQARHKAAREIQEKLGCLCEPLAAKPCKGV